MISKPIVFVLGAGAHVPYGFPTGDQLKSACVEFVTTSFNLRVGGQRFLELVEANLATPEEVQLPRLQLFANKLQSSLSSIDAFLDAHRDQSGFEAIGKATIAEVLLKQERLAWVENKRDWIEYVFTKMLNGARDPDTFKSNKVSFITFNYDRLLESKLLSYIIGSFDVTSEKALEILNAFPIHHVYGKLGKFPIPTNPIDNWITSSRGIRTIFDAQTDHEDLDKAKKQLSSARSICLLGFGFHKENIDLIDLVMASRGCCANGGVVGSSRLGYTESEFSSIIETFGLSPKVTSTIRDGSTPPYDCMAALRNVYGLF